MSSTLLKSLHQKMTCYLPADKKARGSLAIDFAFSLFLLLGLFFSVIYISALFSGHLEQRSLTQALVHYCAYASPAPSSSQIQHCLKTLLPGPPASAAASTTTTTTTTTLVTDQAIIMSCQQPYSTVLALKYPIPSATTSLFVNYNLLNPTNPTNPTNSTLTCSYWDLTFNALAVPASWTPPGTNISTSTDPTTIDMTVFVQCPTVNSYINMQGLGSFSFSDSSKQTMFQSLSISQQQVILPLSPNP